MTLLEFIESKKDEDTPIGDLANDTLQDEEFKSLTTDEERLDYLADVTSHLGDLFTYFENEFNAVKSK